MREKHYWRNNRRAKTHFFLLEIGKASHEMWVRALVPENVSKTALNLARAHHLDLPIRSNTTEMRLDGWKDRRNLRRKQKEKNERERETKRKERETESECVCVWVWEREWELERTIKCNKTRTTLGGDVQSSPMTMKSLWKSDGGEREGETKPEADTDTDDREREGSIKWI